MNLAIINNETNIVENTIVPPTGSTAWFVPEGFTAVYSDVASIGDTWDGVTFIKPTPVEE